jgi:uncharacterized protein YueI
MADDLKVTTTIGADLSQFKQAIGSDAPAIMAAAMNQMQASVNQFSSAVESMGQKTSSAMHSGREATGEMEGGLRSARLEMTESTHAISELGQMTGVHVPRMIARFLSSIEGIAPLMAAAFAPIAILGVLELLGKGVEKLNAWADSVEENKRVWEALRNSTTETNLSITEGLEKVEESLIAVTDGPLAVMDYKLAHLADTSKATFDKITKTAQDAAKQLKSEQSWGSDIAQMFSGLTGEEGPEKIIKNIGEAAEAARLKAVAAQAAQPTGATFVDESGKIEHMRDSAAGYNAAWKEVNSTVVQLRDSIDQMNKQVARGMGEGLGPEITRQTALLNTLYTQQMTLSNASADAVKEDQDRVTINAIAHNNDQLKSTEATYASIHASRVQDFDRDKALVQQGTAQHIYNNEQEVTLLKAINAQKLAEDIRYLNEKIKVEESRQGVSPGAKEAAVTGLKSQESIEKQKSIQEDTALDQAEVARKLAQDETLAAQRISNAQKAGEQEVSIAEDVTRKDFELHKITLDQETEQLQNEAMDRFGIEMTAIDAKSELARTKAAGDQKELKRIDEQEAAEEIALAEKTGIALVNIDSNADRVRQANHKAIVQETANFERQMAQMTASVDKEQNDFKLAMGRETQQKWYDDQVTIMAKEFKAEHDAIQNRIDELRNSNQTTTADFKKANDDMAALEQKRVNDSIKLSDQMAMKWHQQMQSITSSFTSATNEWLTGQKTFMQSLASLWSTTLLAVIDKALQKMVMSFLTSENVMSLAQKLHLTTQVAQKTAADAAQVASNTTKNATIVATDEVTYELAVAAAASAAAQKEAVDTASVEKSVFKKAKDAAAGAYEKYSAFPPLAVAMAGLAFTATMAVGAFEQGGIQSKTGLAFLHQDEMVLPSSISKPLQALFTGAPGLASQGSLAAAFGGGQQISQFQPILNINAVDGQSVRRMLDTHGDVIGDYMFKHIQKRITHGGLRGKMK